MRNYIHYIVWDEITYPLQNFNGANVEVWEWISNYIHTLLGMWLLIYATSKMGPWYIPGQRTTNTTPLTTIQLDHGASGVLKPSAFSWKPLDIAIIDIL